ncbi:MAG: hypothetical protein WDN49_13345 [Acetobacteraceae bacterium]
MLDDAHPAGTDLHHLPVAKASRLIEARQLSPVELTQAFLARVAALNDQLNAYLLVTAETALQQARRAEAEIMAGNGAARCTAFPSR